MDDFEYLPDDLDRVHKLAAEIEGYSYRWYSGKLAIGSVRFTRLMPERVELLERAHRDEWSLERIAAELEFDVDIAQNLLDRYRQAVAIVDAGSPADQFLQAVRVSIENVLPADIDEESIDELVHQIGYRAADLGYLVDPDDEKWKDVWRDLT